MTVATLEVYREIGRTTPLNSGVRLHTTDEVFCTVTFNVPVTFLSSGITTSKCSVADFAAVSSTVYTFKVEVSSAAPRETCKFAVDQTQATDSNGNAGTGEIPFKFIHDMGAQAVSVETANGNEQGVVRIPEGHSITPTSYNREVLHVDVSTRPAGYTPWTHSGTFTVSDVDSTHIVWLEYTLARSSDQRKEIMLAEAKRRLEETDWMLLSDVTTPGGMATYRTALRGVITDFDVSSPPSTVTWPEVPKKSNSGATTDPYPGDIGLYLR